MKVIDKYNLYKNKYSKYIVLIKVGIFINFGLLDFASAIWYNYNGGTYE